MTETLGVGHIGFGDHDNKSHVPFLGPLPLCETIGVADIRAVNVDAITDFVDEPVLTDNYQELLGDNRVGAVVIATRDDSHYSIAKDALEAGKHVLVEKPAAANLAELVLLPELFNLAEANELVLEVCHAREADEDGIWYMAAQLIGEPERITDVFDVGPMGELQELRYDCHYTVPSQEGIHASFADDKLNHAIVSVLRSLPKVVGFRDAVLLDNDIGYFDSRLVTVSKDIAQDGVVVRAGGRRSAHAEHHGDGVYRDWIEAIFDEGVLRVEPTFGTIVLTYGKREELPLGFDPSLLYDDMFRAFNDNFVRRALRKQVAKPQEKRTMLLGTAAAILMQQPAFDGEVSEAAVQRARHWLS